MGKYLARLEKPCKCTKPNIFVMTAILENSDFRNTTNNATIKVQKYFNKFSVALWRVVVKYDTNCVGFVVSEGLKNKPSKMRIKNLCNSFI